MNPLAAERIEVGGQGRYQGFAFTGFHFGDPALVENDAAEDLNREGTHSQHPVAGLAAGRKRIGENIVGALSHLQAIPQFIRLAPEFLLTHGAVGVFQTQHLVAKRLNPLNFPFAVISEKRFN